MGAEPMLEDDDGEDRPTFPDDPSVQHSQLATALAQLKRAARAGGDPRGVCSLLGALIEDLRQHFAAEEYAMERDDYPHTEDHREGHRKFLRHIERVRAECVDGNKGLAPVVAEQLENWFHDHEQTADADLRAHLVATR